MPSERFMRHYYGASGFKMHSRKDPPMPETRSRYTLVEDGNGDLYVVPVERLGEFKAWAAAYGLDDEAGDWPPSWADPLGGDPSRLTFSNPEFK